jgi:hypothetical protein
MSGEGIQTEHILFVSLKVNSFRSTQITELLVEIMTVGLSHLFTE